MRRGPANTPALWMLLAAALSSCSAIKASPAKPTPFLEQPQSLAADPARFPFQKAWFVDLSKIRAAQRNYRQIYVKPVEVRFFEAAKEDGLADAVSFGVSDEEKKDLADYIHGSFTAALQAEQSKGLQVVDRPGSETLAIEIALTELRPTHLAINAGQTLAGFFIPGSRLVTTAINAGTAAAAGPLAAGSIAIEIKFRDGATGALIGEAADRQDDPLTVLVNVQDFTQYGHARNTVDRWAGIAAEFLTTPPEHNVAAPLPLTFGLW